MLVRLGLFLSIVGAQFLVPQLAFNMSRVDYVLLPLVGFGLFSMLRFGSPAIAGWARCLPALWLILLGSVIGLSTVGVTQWALISMGQTLYAVLLFFAVWFLIDVYRMEDVAIRACRWAAILLAITFLVQTYDHRAAASFPNPNLAGHYATTMSAVLMFVSDRRRDHWIGLITLAVALYTTSSFGAIAMTLVMLTVWFVRGIQRYTAVLLAVLVAVGLGTVFFLTQPEEEVPVEHTTVEVSSGLSESRFEKSQTGRFRLWSSGIAEWYNEPWGLGPGGTVERRVDSELTARESIGQIHSDPLGMLIDRGPLGLIGWIALWATLWAIARPKGIARILIAGFLTQAMFRETLHYRHMWIALAIALVVDARTRDRAVAAVETPGPDAAEVAVVTAGDPT